MAGSVQDDIRKFQLEINTSNNNGETLAQLTKLEKETAKLRNQNEELQKVMAHLAATGKKDTEEYKRMEEQLKLNRKTIKQNADEMKGLQKNLDLNYMSMTQLRKRATELRSTLNSMSKAANPEEYDRLEKELGQVGNQMDKLRGKTDKLKSTVAPAAGSLNDLKNKASKLQKELDDTSKAANPKEYDKLEKELKQVNAQIDKLKGKGKDAAKALEAPKTRIDKLKASAKELLPAFGWGAIISGAIALGKKLFDLSQQTFEYQQQVAKLTGESGPALQMLTAKLTATAETFNVEFEKLATANHNFAESMEISEQQANDLINKGFLAGADASGEFLDKLKEYGPQFKAAGISAEQAIAIMSEEVRTGIWSDKGTDAIKEATIALREMPQTARDAVDAIGLSSEEMMKQLASGEITVFEAMQQVSRKMGELPPQSAEVGQALADIFKGAGEDAGLDYILMLGETKASMDDLIDKTGELGDITQKTLTANTNLAVAWNFALGENNRLLTKSKNFVKQQLAQTLAVYSTGLKLIFQGREQTIKEFKQAVEESNKETFKEQNEYNSNLNRLIIKAQKELNIAENKAIRERTEQQIEAEKERWEKEKTALEARLVTKAKLNAREIELNEILHKLIEEKERYHQETLASIKAKAAKKVKTPKPQQLAETIEADKDLDTSDLDRDVEKDIDAAIAFEKAKADAIEKYRQFSLEELQAEEMSMLQKAYDEKLISEEVFQQAKAEIEKRYAELQAEEDARLFQEKIAKYQEYIGLISMAASGFSQVVQNLQAAEFEDLEARRDKGEIDQEAYEQESLKIKKKYADKQFVAALANIIASTAQGVMQSYAHFDPITASILAAIPISVGATQAILANKQRQRVKSMYKGGYTGAGSKYEEKQLVQLHADEYVIPKEGVNNPNVKPFIEMLENQRVAGTIGSMNFPKVTGAANGGYQNVQNSQAENLTAGNSIDVIAQNTAVMQMLLTKGIKAAAYFDNETTRDIKEQQDEDQRLLDQTK